jgi:putative ABC transport system permease protein
MGLLISGRQLLRDLRSQKLRTFLTTLGLVWGTVSVSLLMAFGEGMHHQMLKNAAGLGRGVVIAWPSMTSIPYEGLGRGRVIRLNEDDMSLLKRRSVEIGMVSSEYSRLLKVQQGGRTLSVDVHGVLPAFGEVRNLIPQKGGRFLDPLDERLKRRVAFVGDDLAEQLFRGVDPVGQELRIQGSPFTVIGVLQRKIQNSSYSGRDKDQIVVPASTFRMLTGDKWVDNFIFTAKDVQRTEQAQKEVLSILAAKHRFDPEDEEALGIWDTSQQTKFLDSFMLAFKLFLGIVGSLTLVVGGIGVSNIMNVVVEERTHEIGVKMALGARSGSVLTQFLLETLTITAVGGAIGLALSAVICGLVPPSDFIGKPELSPTVGVITASLLGMIGLIAGFFPARTAARLDPVVAMKM